MNRPFYSTFAWAYDQLIEGRVNERVSFVASQVQRCLESADVRLLDAGCGTGTYAVALAQSGFQVIGVDSSEDMIAEAKRKSAAAGVYVDFIVGDILGLPREISVNAVLCRGVLNDLIDKTSRDTVFSSFAAAMSKGGVLVLDVRDWEPTVVRKTKSPVFEKTVTTENGQLTFRSITTLRPESHSLLISETQKLQSRFGEETVAFEFEMKCWTQEELAIRLTDSGFGAVNYYGDYDSVIPVGATDRLVAVAVLSEKQCPTRRCSQSVKAHGTFTSG